MIYYDIMNIITIMRIGDFQDYIYNQKEVTFHNSYNIHNIIIS
jgi:hypothetical protein